MLTNILSNEIIHALTWTLLHSIWQISIVAIILSITLKLCHNADALRKYYLSVGALIGSMIIAVITFVTYYQPPIQGAQDLSHNLMLQAQLSESYDSGMMTSMTTCIQDYNFIIVNAWLIGSLLFFIKFIGGYVYLKGVVKNAVPSSDRMTSILKRINKKYRINRAILIKESIKITTPMVVGFIKPVILFPIGLAAQLSVSELEAILAHELAHIKRHDYLFNFIQIISESIFYFHPAIWYISSRIRHEREHCCDDMAIKATNSSMSYARTLIKLQELNIKNIQPALAIASNKKEFSQRIRRIMGLGYIANYTRDRLILVLLIISTGCIYATDMDNQDKNNDPYEIYVIDDCPQAPENIKFYLDTIPDRNFFKIKKQTNNEDIELEMENGEIAKLRIDGREIPESEYQFHEAIVERLKPDHKNDIITLFPDCDDQLGKIYYLDKLGDQVINLDSLVAELKTKTGGYENFDYSFLDFNVNQHLEQMIVDSVENRLKDIEQFHFPNNNDVVIEMDSIEKILGEKYDSLFGMHESRFFPHRLDGSSNSDDLKQSMGED